MGHCKTNCLIGLLLIIYVKDSEGQSSSNSCSQYLRNTHRMGPNIQGRLEIPTDKFYPKYKIKVGFSSPIHHMTIRQSRAKDMGNHQDFLLDPMEMRKDGKLHLDVFIRLQRLFGHAPRLSRIVYNNVVLCGDALDISEVEEAFLEEPSTDIPTTTPMFNSSASSTTQTWKTKLFEEDEDIFHDELDAEA